MTKQLTTEEAEQLQLQDAFAERQAERDVFAGSGKVLGEGIFDFFGKLNLANALLATGGRQIGRGRGIMRGAGKGAAGRLATARGQKGALARDAIRQAATTAVSDPTGAGTVDLARNVGKAVQAAQDTSEDETREMKREIAAKMVGLAEVEKGEQKKQDAAVAKSEARLGLAQKAFEGGMGALQGINPQDYGTKLESKIAREQVKEARFAKKGKGFAEKFKDPNLSMEERKKIAKQQDKFAKKATEARTARKGFESDLANLESAENKKLRLKFAGLFKDVMTPETETKTETDLTS